MGPEVAPTGQATGTAGVLHVRLTARADDFLRTFRNPLWEVRIDGELVARMFPGESAALEVAPGPHLVQIAAGQSQPVEVGWTHPAGEKLYRALVPDRTRGTPASQLHLELESPEDAAAAAPRDTPIDLRLQPITPELRWRVRRAVWRGQPLFGFDRTVAVLMYESTTPAWWSWWVLFMVGVSAVDSIRDSAHHKPGWASILVPGLVIMGLVVALLRVVRPTLVRRSLRRGREEF